jgi:hypothetical protein
VSHTGKGTIGGSIDAEEAEMTFEQVERAMQFMLEQQARTDARLQETGELLNKVGLKLDIVAADAATFRSDIGKLHDEIASVKEIALSHNQAIHQLFRLHEQTDQKFERLYQQRKDDFELSQQNFEILNEQRERDLEATRQKFELLDEQWKKAVEQRRADLEATRQKFEMADRQRQEDIEATRKKFELGEERRARDMEETRKKFELADERREKDVKATLDLINQITHKIDSLTDALTKPGQNGRQ